MDPGFRLCAPVLKRAAGRPRKSRYRRRSKETGLGARQRKCKRCGGSGYFCKYCDNVVDPAFGESSDENHDQQPDATENENVAPNNDSDDDAPNDEFDYHAANNNYSDG